MITAKNNRLPAVQSLGANLKNQISAQIVADCHPKQQTLPTHFLISWYIQNHRLTESLEILTESGIDDDLAVLIITNFQSLEVGNA